MIAQQPPKDSNTQRKRRLGEQLMEDGLISAEQLQQVLKRQAQAGGQLGSILIEMGFVALDDLLDLLSRKFGVPGVNLYQRNVKNDVLQLIPVEKMTAMQVLPIDLENRRCGWPWSTPRTSPQSASWSFPWARKSGRS